MATVGPFEKQLYPLPSTGAGPGETLGATTLCRAQASPFEQLTNHSGACWAVLGPWTYSGVKECTGNQDDSCTALSGGATGSVTGRNTTSMSEGPQPLPLTHVHQPPLEPTMEETGKHTHTPACSGMASHSFVQEVQC